jgi:hypothetical protein
VLVIEQSGVPDFVPPQNGDASPGGAWALLDFEIISPSGINIQNFVEPFSFHPQGVTACMCDGSGKWIGQSASREALQAVLSRDFEDRVDDRELR